MDQASPAWPRCCFAAHSRPRTAVGDLTFAAFSCASLNTNFLAAGDPLAEVQREAEHGLEFAAEGAVRRCWSTSYHAARADPDAARLDADDSAAFDDEQFDELRFEQHLSADPAFGAARDAGIGSASCRRASLPATMRRPSRPHRRRNGCCGHHRRYFETAEYHFYAALSRAACCDSAPPDQRQQHLEALAAHHRQLEIWAENCPENFENRAALVGAEIARLEGRELDAERLYEQAIRSARANGFVHNEALAYELAARFYAARGFEEIAAHLSAKRPRRLSALGSRWQGAATRGDVSAPQGGRAAPGPTSTIGAPVEHLDLATVIKVSQAVSGEIVLEKLIDTLMRTAIEQAGAERGLLILSHGAEQRIEAEATTERRYGRRGAARRSP